MWENTADRGWRKRPCYRLPKGDQGKDRLGKIGLGINIGQVCMARGKSNVTLWLEDSEFIPQLS